MNYLESGPIITYTVILGQKRLCCTGTCLRNSDMLVHTAGHYRMAAYTCRMVAFEWSIAFVCCTGMPQQIHGRGLPALSLSHYNGRLDEAPLDLGRQQIELAAHRASHMLHSDHDAESGVSVVQSTQPVQTSSQHPYLHVTDHWESAP